MCALSAKPKTSTFSCGGYPPHFFFLRQAVLGVPPYAYRTAFLDCKAFSQPALLVEKSVFRQADAADRVCRTKTPYRLISVPLFLHKRFINSDNIFKRRILRVAGTACVRHCALCKEQNVLFLYNSL